MIKKIYLLFFLVFAVSRGYANEKELFKTVQTKATAGELSSIMEMGRRFTKGIDVKEDPEEGLKWYKQALAKNYTPAFKFFADAYYYGNKHPLIKQDYKQAYDYYKKAASKNDAEASYMAGFISFNGDMGKPDYRDALTEFANACPKEIYACIYLGVMYRYGIFVKPDEKQAEHYFSFLEKMSVSDVAETSSDAYFNRGRRLIYRAPADAVDLLQKSYQMGKKEAGVLAKIVIINDNNAYKNSIKGIEIVKEEADKGDVDAMNRLGEIYYDSKIVPKDIIEAKKWFQMATDRGDVLASRNLALLYLKDDNDAINALRWFLNSAEGGDGAAAYYTGQLYAHNDLLKDEKRAEDWFERAAELGDARSMAIIGAMYAKGSKLIKKDMSKAYAWLLMASNRFTGEEKNKLYEKALAIKTHLDEQELEKASKTILKYQK